MNSVNYNLNSYQMNLKVEKKGKDEKTAESQNEEKGAVKADETQKPVQVEANALELLAQQNKGLGIVANKPKDIKGASDNRDGIEHLPGYDELVSEWNKTNGYMSNAEKVDFLAQILSKVGNDKEAECKWGEMRMRFYIQLQEEPYLELLSDLENGIINGNEINWSDLSEYMPEGAIPMFPGIWIPHEYDDYYGGTPAAVVELYGSDHSSWPKNIQITTLRATLAELNLFLTQFEIKSYNPNLSNEELAELRNSINNYSQWKQEIEQQIRELLGIIKKEENTAIQNSNLPNEM